MIKFLGIITFVILIGPCQSFENKIIMKIDNNIITTYDIIEETNYLSILNPSFKSLSKNEIFNISKNSLIREKIKEIELLKNLNQIKIEDSVFDQFLNQNAKKFKLNTKEEFMNLIKDVNVNLENFRKKITIDILWNQLIYQKFSSKVKIDKESLKQKIYSSERSKAYLLNEIVYKAENLSNQKSKLEEISKSIKLIGFENTALNYSISESSKEGGRIGWLEEAALNSNVLEKIKKLELNDYTDPINIPSGFLILQLKEVKETKNIIDYEKKLEELIIVSTNQQLNQYSNLYYNKASKDLVIDEK